MCGTVGQPLDRLVFALRTAATSIRATAATPPRIVVEAPSMVRGELQRLAAQGYWDAVLDAAGSGWQSGGVLTGAVAALRADAGPPWPAGVDGGVGRRTDAAGVGRSCTRRALAGRLARPGRRWSTSRVRRRRTLSASIAIPVSLDRVAVLEACAADRPVVSEPTLPVERIQLAGGASTRPDGRAGGGSFRRRRARRRHPGA